MASTILFKTDSGFTLEKGSTTNAVVGIFSYSIDTRGNFSKTKRGAAQKGGKNVYFIPNEGVRLSDAEGLIRRGKLVFTKEEGLPLGPKITLSTLGNFIQIDP